PGGANDERRLDHAGALGAFAGDGAGFADAGRADESFGFGVARMVSELPERLSGSDFDDFARPGVFESVDRQHHRNPARDVAPLSRKLRFVSGAAGSACAAAFGGV